MSTESIVGFMIGMLFGVCIGVGAILYDAGDGEIVFFGHTYKSDIKVN